MAAKTAPHTARTAVTFTHATESIRCELTFAWQDPTDNLFSDPAGFAAQVWAGVTTDLVPVSTTQVVYDGIVYEDIRSIPYGGADFPQTPTAGTIAGSGVDLPTDSCFSLKRTTGAVGRSYRGRLYFPVWDSGVLQTADTLFAINATNLATALGNFQATVEGGTYPCTMVLVSFVSGGALRDPGIATPVTGWSYADLNVDSQRRRLLGRGR